MLMISYWQQSLILIRFHYVKDLVSNNCINVEYCPSEKIVADILTKALDRIKFVDFREKLGLIERIF